MTTPLIEIGIIIQNKNKYYVTCEKINCCVLNLPENYIKIGKKKVGERLKTCHNNSILHQIETTRLCAVSILYSVKNILAQTLTFNF